MDLYEMAQGLKLSPPPKHGPADGPREKRVVVSNVTPQHLLDAAERDGKITETHRLVEK